MSTQLRKPRAERREEIAKSVLQIIGTQGITAVNTASLAESVGLTSGALFRHFATIDEILVEAIRYAATRIEGTFPDTSLPPFERLQQLAENRVDLLRSEPGIVWLLRSEQAYLALPEDAVGLMKPLVKRTKAFALSAFREGAAQGCFRTDIEPEIQLVLFLGCVHTLIDLPSSPSRSPKRTVNPTSVLSAFMQLITTSSNPDSKSH